MFIKHVLPAIYLIILIERPTTITVDIKGNAKGRFLVSTDENFNDVVADIKPLKHILQLSNIHIKMQTFVILECLHFFYDDKKF